MSVLGHKVVYEINKFENDYNRLPVSLEELKEKNRINVHNLDANIIWKYDITDHEKRNKNSKNHPNYIPMQKDVFNLYLRKDFLGLENLRYKREENKFELYDDI